MGLYILLFTESFLAVRIGVCSCYIMGGGVAPHIEMFADLLEILIFERYWASDVSAVIILIT